MRIGDGVPVVLTGDADGPVVFERLPPRDPSLAEDFIQRLIADHPSILPIEQLDPTFAPAVSIGREIGTSVGPIDALYISPDGGLTIVEAKLWRNPQARREVVGQIIDYATAISSWSYEELDAVCRRATGQSLWTTVSPGGDGTPTQGEARFIDEVARNLRCGRFLLLIVGDGIREEVERMAAYVQSSPRLQFHLALVELGIFEAADPPLRCVVPSVVARTAEITRAVVKVDVAEQAHVDVDVSVPIDDSPATRRQLTMEQFFTELDRRTNPQAVRFVSDVFEHFEQDPRFLLSPKSASVVLHLRNPDGGSDFTVLVFETAGRAFPGWLEGQCNKAGVPPEIATRFATGLSRTLGIPIHHKQSDKLSEPPTIEAIEEHWPDVSEWIDDLAEEIRQHLTI